MVTDGSEQQTSWVEAKCAQLIARIRRSQFRKACFADARHFASQGYQMDVALQMSWNYWGS